MVRKPFYGWIIVGVTFLIGKHQFIHEGAPTPFGEQMNSIEKNFPSFYAVELCFEMIGTYPAVGRSRACG